MTVPKLLDEYNVAFNVKKLQALIKYTWMLINKYPGQKSFYTCTQKAVPVTGTLPYSINLVLDDTLSTILRT